MIMARAFDEDHEESPLDEPRFSARDFLEVLMQKRVFRPNNTQYNFDKIVVHINHKRMINEWSNIIIHRLCQNDHVP